MYKQGTAGTMTTLVGLLALLAFATTDLSAQRFVRSDSLRQIQSVVPMSGPAGTRIAVARLPHAARIENDAIVAHHHRCRG